MSDNLFAERLKKRKQLEAADKDPYPATTHRTDTIAGILKSFTRLKLTKKKVTIVGRIFAARGQGKIVFLDVKDESGSMQAVIKDDVTTEFQLFRDTIDIGDFVEVTGKVFVTKRGEKSIEVKNARVISKSMRPIPSEWYGISDIETRLRKRYLDLIAHPELRELFRQKARFWASIRSFLIQEGFLEVETPVLEQTPGGADAEPFMTHHNALDIDMSLRISLELPLKRLLVGGFEKVFEIGRIFRNEGIDAEHLQDYTQMEYYWAYQDYEGGMRFIEKMYKHAIKAAFGSLKIPYKETTLDWGKRWERVDYFSIFKEKTGIDLATVTESELRAYAKKQGIDEAKHPGRGRIIDAIFKKIRHTLIQPCFLINPPVEIEPLAKRLAPNSNRVARFQVVAAGTELGKGFSELNDPIDQRARFEEQMRLREAGDKEAQQLDEDYLEAMEYGMPPCHGFGVSERLFSVLAGKPIRETVLFPILRPKSKE